MEEGVWIVFVLLIALPPQLSDAVNDNSLESDAKDLPARWLTGVYGPCTVDCGRGRQVRAVRCVRDIHWRGRTMETTVPDSLCPNPRPDKTRPCNEHPCTALWVKGDWSECSVSCGIGTQTREVRCENTMLSGQRYQVSPSDCGGQSPASTRQCHTVDCPYRTDSGIRAKDYTLIQFRRAKKLKVTVGGVVKLLPGQTVLVKCPVNKVEQSLVYWSKGYRLVSPFGRVKFTRRGALKIRKADPKTDSGVYTCVLGDQHAKVEVQFITKHDPITKTYKTWIQKSRKQLRHQLKKYRHGGAPHASNDVLLRSGGGRPLELRQRDQSQRKYHLSYVAGEWSDCSATCRVPGHRKRKVTCSHVTTKYVKLVPDKECVRAGLAKPVSLQECSSQADCAVWVPGPWTECRPRCGPYVGYKTRYLVCQKAKSGLPAWDACDRNNKPVTRKPCKNKPCPSKCTNKSRYCSVAGLLKMCRYPTFRRKCCKTCHSKSVNSTV